MALSHVGELLCFDPWGVLSPAAPALVSPALPQGLQLSLVPGFCPILWDLGCPGAGTVPQQRLSIHHRLGLFLPRLGQ